MSVQYGGDKITFADGSVVASGWSGMKNRIINGAMMIDQRNAGASVGTSGLVGTQPFITDRWYISGSQNSKFTIQQNAGSVTPPAGFTNYLGVTSSSAYSITSSDYFGLAQRIEGFNIADFGFGTANATPITLSFWVRSSLTGTFGGYVSNGSFARAYPFSYTISSANTWEQKTITIVGDTTGTWTTNNGTGLVLLFSLGYGSNYNATAGVWNAGTGYTPAGATSVVGTNGATFYITGVQLEKGSTATSFDYRPYGTELQLCQRYYQLAEGFSACGANSTTLNCTFQFKTEMRTSPSVGTTGLVQITQPGINDFTQSSTSVAIIASRVSTRGVQVSLGNYSSVLNAGYFYNHNVSINNAAVSLSAEL